MNPLYSVVIPTHGQKGLDLLKDNLPFITYNCNAPHEVFVVDDGSPPEVKDELGKVCASNGANIVQLEKNGGFAHAVNQGIIRSNGEVVILCNNDIITIGHCLDYLAEFTLATGCGVVGCKLLYPNHRVQHAGVFYVPNPSGEGHGWFDHLYRHHPRHTAEASVIAERACTGALLVLSAGLLSAVGLLDERFGMACEDLDMNLRCLEVGMRVLYNGHIEAYHFEGQTRGATPETKAEHPEWTEAERIGMERFFVKWRGFDFNTMKA